MFCGQATASGSSANGAHRWTPHAPAPMAATRILGFYLLFGVISTLSLGFNLLLLVALLSMLQATLTLPGIALVFDGVEERLHVVVLAADQPDDELLVVTLFVLVAPRQHAFHAVAVDGDVLVAVVAHRGHDGQLDLRIRRLVLQHVDQFAHSHVGLPFVRVVRSFR